MRKKVLFIAHVQSHIMNFHLPFLRYFNEKEYDVFVATNMDREKYSNLKNLDFINWIDVDYPRNPLSKKIIKSFFQTRQLMKENDFDLIHTHTPVGGVIGRLSNLFEKNNKILYTAHGFHFYKGANIKNWLIYFNLEKLMARYTDTIITINEEDYLIAKRHFKTRKEIVKINGVGLDLNKYKVMTSQEIKKKRIELGYKDDEFIVIMIAELNENKNQIQLIKAIQLLKNKCPKLKTILVGDGEKLEALQKEVKKRELIDNISFLGFRTDINELINISNIGTLLSYREGLPKSVMEILASGKKVIGTNIRGIRDLISSDEAGKLVSVGDYKKTSEFIEDYYKEFINKTESIVPKNIIQNFDVENIKKQIEKLI